jgi:hypothetical protein
MFPYLPQQLLEEALRCKKPIIEYTHPTLLTTTNIQALPQSPTTLTSQESHIIMWNATSLNTTMSCLQDLTTYSQIPPTIISIQETKITATKYISNHFPHYKFYFNNTYNITRIMRQRLIHRRHRGGLLTLIHNKHAFPGNLLKLPTLQTSHHSFK